MVESAVSVLLLIGLYGVLGFIIITSDPFLALHEEHPKLALAFVLVYVCAMLLTAYLPLR